MELIVKNPCPGLGCFLGSTVMPKIIAKNIVRKGSMSDKAKKNFRKDSTFPFNTAVSVNKR